LAADMVDSMTRPETHHKPCGCQEIVYDNRFGKARSTILCWHHSQGPGKFESEANVRQAAAIGIESMIEDLECISEVLWERDVIHIGDFVNKAIENLTYAKDYLKELEELND